MSRIGKQPILIAEGVTVKIDEKNIVVRGPKGELVQPLFPQLKVEIKDGRVVITRNNDDKKTRALHGLLRSLIFNAIEGVSTGFEKRLELVGTGYRVKKEGPNLTMTLGFSHPVTVEPIENITLEIKGEKQIIVKGINKQKVGQVAANIRSFRKPEPYKGKGVRYKDEVVRRKPGKAAKVGADLGGA